MSEVSRARNRRVQKAALVVVMCLGAGCADLTAPSTNATVTAGATPTAAAAPAPAQAAPTAAAANPNLPRPRQGLERITASHILVSYKGASRAQPTVTRTKQEAQQRAEALLARVRKGDDFAAVARAESDDPSAKEHGGNLGTFDRFSSVRPFSDAAFALEINQLSAVVETEYGFHIIKRTG